MSNRKLKLYIAMSLDGYVATHDDDLSFLSTVEVAGEDYGYAAFTQTIDTYMIGRKTYDVIKKMMNGEFPHARQYQCYIITHQEREPENGVIFYNGDLKKLVAALKAQEGKDIYCDGGPELIKSLLEQNLVDEFTISVIPVLLGGGKSLFPEGISYQQLKHVETKSFASGLVQLRYTKMEMS